MELCFFPTSLCEVFVFSSASHSRLLLRRLPPHLTISHKRISHNSHISTSSHTTSSHTTQLTPLTSHTLISHSSHFISHIHTPSHGRCSTLTLWALLLCAWSPPACAWHAQHFVHMELLLRGRCSTWLLWGLLVRAWSPLGSHCLCMAGAASCVHGATFAWQVQRSASLRIAVARLVAAGLRLLVRGKRSILFTWSY